MPGKTWPCLSNKNRYLFFFFSYLNNYFILENYAYTCHRTTNILFNFYSENHKYHETWSNGIQSQETTFTEIVEEEWR